MAGSFRSFGRSLGLIHVRRHIKPRLRLEVNLLDDDAMRSTVPVMVALSGVFSGIGHRPSMSMYSW